MPAERTPPTDDSLLAWPLLAMTEWTLRAPATVLTGAVALAFLAAMVSINGLTFKTDRLDLLNPRSEYNRRWLAYLAEFGSRDDAVVVIRAQQAGELTPVIDDLAAQLRAEPQWFESVFYRRDLSRLKGKILHYLPPAELARLQQQLSQAAALLPRPGEPADPAAQLGMLNDRLAHVGVASVQQRAAIEAEYARMAGMMLAGLAGPMVAGGRPTVPAEQARESGFPSVQASANMAPVSPLPDRSGASVHLDQPLDALGQFDPQYLLADNGKIGFVLTRFGPQARETAASAQGIARLRELIAQMRVKYPRVWIGLTGMPVIEHDEMQASQFDMVWTSLASLGLVILLYLAAYGGLRHAILLNVVLVLATAYSFGFVTLAVGHLNILSSAFSAVLIGLGIDFAIHYVATYLKLRQVGCDAEAALVRTAVEVGPGVVTGGVTTAAAFFMAAMTDFIGVRELGLVAGGGILLCVLSAVVILPPLVLVVDRRWPLVRVPTILPAGRWVELPLRWPRLTMAATLLVTLLVGGGAACVRYDHNLLNLQPRHLESADIERQLLSHLDDSVWFAVSVCASRQELRTRKAAFEKLPIVAKTEEIGSLLPDPTAEQAQRITALGRQLAALPEKSPQVAAVDLTRLKQEVARAQELLRREIPYETPASMLLAQLRAALTAAPAGPIEIRLGHAAAAALARATGELNALRALADPVPPRLDDLPKELTDRFIGAHRTYLLKVYARGNIWNMHELERFVRAVESVDPQVTGHPVQTYYASRHMQQSYLWAGLYALGAVLVLLWIDFRSLWHSLLAMVPLALGFVQMCGLIGWLDIPLNAANMIVLPLILGIGVDHGVHLVHLWRQQRGRFTLSDTTTTAVVLTATTTTASFGALILARHQGLQSLGQVLTIGVTTCLASSILFFPALLAWLSRNRQADEANDECRNSKVEGMTNVGMSNDGIEKRFVAVPPPLLRTSQCEGRESMAAERQGGRKSIAASGGAAKEDQPPESTPDPVRVIAPQPIAATSEPPIPQSFVVPTSASPEPVVPLTPAPVTDEEIAALLESALTPQPLRLADLAEEDSSAEGGRTPSTPRRRHLPRRSEAA